MAGLFSDEARYRRWFEVEVASLEAWAAQGSVPVEAVEAIKGRARFTPEGIEAIEAEVRHDVVAFTQAVSDSVGPWARYFHFGLTSSDVTDTALALTLTEAASLILVGISDLRRVLRRRAEEERSTLTVGRTHGMFAEPMALGLKFALWHDALRRDAERVEAARRALSVGKLSGAIGTYTAITPEVERAALERLGLEPAPVSTQVLDRDRHAQYLAALAVMGGTLEKITLEVRLLQRSEVAEMGEPFHRGQKGSSAMPHKRNPVSSERVAGLARLLRAYAGAGFEDIALWHERDISHSSTERVALADASILADFMLAEGRRIVEGLRIDRQRMRDHVFQSGGLVFSQKVLLGLVEAGLAREEAYRIVQAAAMEALDGGDFKASLLASEKVRRSLGADGLEALFDVGPYLAHTDTILERTLKEGESERD